MPKLNARGDVICGGGGNRGSVNQQPYPFDSFGRGCWLDADTILVALAPSGSLYAWHPFSDPGGAARSLVDAQPFNFLAGGGGKYAALVAPSRAQPTPFLYGSLGNIAGAGAPDVAADGTIVYKTEYAATYGLTIVTPGQPSLACTDALATGFQALPGGQAIWPGGAHGRAPARPFFADASDVRLATVQGEDWLMYWSGSNGVVVQPDGASEGFVFQSNTMFNRDMIAVGDHLLIVSSLTDGEAPSDLVKFTVNRSGVVYLIGRGPSPAFAALQPPPVVVTPINPPVNPPVVPVVPVNPVVPVKPTSPFPVAQGWTGHMKVFAKLHGQFTGVDPSAPDTVYTNRAHGGAWELIELTPHAGGFFDARYVTANRQLSIQPDGSLQTRPSGSVGPYELLRATQQPEGIALIYRADAAGNVLGVPLTIQAA